MADDAVQLTDLEVIQRWSLAVRSASADRGELVAALRADLAWLEGRRSARAASGDDDDAPVRRRTPAKRTTRSTTRTATKKSVTGRATSTRRR